MSPELDVRYDVYKGNEQGFYTQQVFQDFMAGLEGMDLVQYRETDTKVDMQFVGCNASVSYHRHFGTRKGEWHVQVAVWGRRAGAESMLEVLAEGEANHQ